MLLRNFTSSFSNLLKRRLFFATGITTCAINSAILISPKRPSSKTQLENLSPVLSTSIREFLDVDEINQLYKFFKPVDDFNNSYIFVSDEKIAQDIAKKILEKTNKENQIVVEANPGLGLITVNLLNCGVKQIHIFENYALQKLPAYQILSKYFMAVTENRILLHSHRIMDFLLNAFRLGQINDSSIKFVGTFTECYFLRSLVPIIINNLLVDKEFEIYLISSADLYRSLKVYNSKRFRYLQYCVLNLFFYIEELASYPRSGFLPPSKQNNEIMYLSKITRNSNFLKNINNTEMKEYLIFITLLGGKKKFVIQTLEKWLPNCGLYLISKGVSMTNKIHDFSPQESFYLFKIFQKCEGYNEFRNFALELF